MTPYIGQLLLVGFNFAPVGWAAANGQLLPISSYTALFSLLGTTYGGNGSSNFGLPNLLGACAVGMGQGPGLSNYYLGETGGTTTVTLISSQMPAHTHTVQSKAALATETVPAGNCPADSTSAGAIYVPAASIGNPQLMNAAAITSTGGGLPHNNMMPYLALNWIIALQGVFPSRP